MNFNSEFRQNVDIDGTLKINGTDIFKLIYPVGAIYMSVNNIKPSTLFGGTWALWGSGRVLVCVNTSDSDFSYSGKTGGTKTHTHTLYSAAAMIGSDLGQANTLAFCARNLGDMSGTAYSLASTNITPSYQRSHKQR